MKFSKWVMVGIYMLSLMIYTGSAFSEESAPQKNSAEENEYNLDEARKIGFFAHLGYGFGGDKFASLELEYDDGDTRDESLKAGEGVIWGAGLLIPIGADGNVEAQLGIGMKEEKITAENGKVSFRRFPLDAMVFFKQGKFRLGGGITYHLHPEISGHGAVGSLDASFENAFGFVVEADILFNMVYLGVRGAFVDYTLEHSDVDADGNSVEILAGVRF